MCFFFFPAKIFFFPPGAGAREVFSSRQDVFGVGEPACDCDRMHGHGQELMDNPRKLKDYNIPAFSSFQLWLTLGVASTSITFSGRVTPYQ